MWPVNVILAIDKLHTTLQKALDCGTGLHKLLSGENVITYLDLVIICSCLTCLKWWKSLFYSKNVSWITFVVFRNSHFDRMTTYLTNSLWDPITDSNLWHCHLSYWQWSDVSLMHRWCIDCHKHIYSKYEAASLGLHISKVIKFYDF